MNINGYEIKPAADLRGAYLQEADLRGAYLQGAYLQEAYLQGADLRGAYLQGADLRGAHLQGAYLQGADLRGAKNIPDYIQDQFMVCPEVGAFIGWKKVARYIIKLQIPASAKRSSATGRKCRCSKAKVLAIYGGGQTIDHVTNTAYFPRVTYTVGEYVYPDSFDEDRWNECSHGIHFFITRGEAERY